LRIRRIRLVNFRRYADHEIILDPGFNLIVGPNESGKSTVVDAIATALFGDVASKARTLKELERWGSPGAMRLEFDFDHGKQSWRLVKDFGAGRSELAEVGGLEVIGDRGEVDRRVREMVGFATRDAFESVAAVRQGELAALEGRAGSVRRNELVPMIERKMTSSSGAVDAARVLERIDGELARIKVGLERPAKVPGPLQALREERQRLTGERAKHEAAWGENLRARTELNRLREESEDNERHLAQIELALKHEDKRQDDRSTRDRVQKALDEKEAKIGRIRKLKADLEAVWDRIPAGSNEYEKLARAAKADFDAAERRLADLTDRAPSGRLGAVGGRAGVGAGAAIVSGIILLLAAVFGRALGLRVSMAAAGVGATLVGFLLARRAVKMWAFVREVDRATYEREKRETLLTTALSKAGCSSYADFERAAGAQERDRHSAEVWNAMLTEICGGQDPNALEEILQRDAASLSRQLEELDEALGPRGGEALLGPADYAKLHAEHEQRVERLRALRESIPRLEGQLEQAETGETLPDLDAKFEEIDREVARLERRLRVLGISREALASAIASTNKEAASAVEPVVSRALSHVTLGRYEAARVGHDLDVTVANPERRPGGPATLGTGDLSAGTADQLYLAIRYALLEFLSTADGAPFVLDDALVNCDPERRAAGLSLLREIAKERQVILFSCEDRGRDAADRVVFLPAI
jgi:DNA repair exonuclease SbcCD ATPase subunit